MIHRSTRDRAKHTRKIVEECNSFPEISYSFARYLSSAVLLRHKEELRSKIDQNPEFIECDTEKWLSGIPTLSADIPNVFRKILEKNFLRFRGIFLFCLFYAVVPTSINNCQEIFQSG